MLKVCCIIMWRPLVNEIVAYLSFTLLPFHIHGSKASIARSSIYNCNNYNLPVIKAIKFLLGGKMVFFYW